jgi:putative ABC transport system substrate-binding protein
MRRRDFIMLLGVSAAWPLAARAQQNTIPVVGFVHSQLADTYGDRLRAFRQGLADAGYVEGRNVAVQYHSAEGQPARLRTVVADLVRLPVAVIVGNTVAALAAKAATTTIPVVFYTGRRSRRGRSCRQPRPAGRQCHGGKLFRQCLGAKATGAAA